MRFLAFVSVCYLLAMPVQAQSARPKFVTIGLQGFLHNAESGNWRYMFDKVQEFIDYNSAAKSLAASSIALTVRRFRSIFPAEDYAKMLGITPEELQSIENGTLLPNGVLWQKIHQSLGDETILNYYRDFDALEHSPIAITLIRNIHNLATDNLEDAIKRQLEDTANKQQKSIIRIVETEAFIASFEQARQAAEDGSDKDAQAIAIVEENLQQDYPDAPSTFAQLMQEAAEVTAKLKQDNKFVAKYYDSLAAEITQGQQAE